METVFDYNITEEERDIIGVVYNKLDYLKEIGEDTSYMHIAYLHWHRKNVKMADFFANKIKNNLRRFDCLRTIHHE